jgi:hypothetical protein
MDRSTNGRSIFRYIREQVINIASAPPERVVEIRPKIGENRGRKTIASIAQDCFNSYGTDGSADLSPLLCLSVAQPGCLSSEAMAQAGAPEGSDTPSLGLIGSARHWRAPRDKPVAFSIFNDMTLGPVFCY